MGFVVFYQYRNENGDTGRKGSITYDTSTAAMAMRRFFAEYGGKKDRIGNIITPIAVSEI